MYLYLVWCLTQFYIHLSKLRMEHKHSPKDNYSEHEQTLISFTRLAEEHEEGRQI